jgi:ATP-binding cassette, subfamily B, bacterial CvaB/MchF/RaxB
MSTPRELLFSSRKHLPVFIASEISECGLACLAMIARYHGHNVDLNGLRQLATISIAGANMRGLMRLGDELGLGCRPLKVELGALENVQLPAIIHWNLNHFVVLKSISSERAIIHDPSRGRIVVPLSEMSNHFTGVVLELRPSTKFEPLDAIGRINPSDLWSNLKGMGSSFAFILTVSIALQAVAFLAPFQMQLVVDQAIGRQDSDILVLIALGFGVISLLAAGIQAIRDWTVQLLGSQFVFQVTGNVFRHLLRMPADFFEKRHVGDILARIGSLRAIQDAVTHGVVSSVIDGFMVGCAVILLFFYSTTIGVIVLGSILLVAAMTICTYPFVRRRTEQAIVASANEQTHLMESIRAAVTIKLAGIEAERHGLWRNLSSRSFNSAVRVQRFQIILGFAQSALLGLQAVLVLYLGAKSTLSADGISIGMLYALFAFRGVATERALSLINQGTQIRMLGLHFERLADIVGHPPETPFEEPGVSLPQRKDIGLHNVSFRYGSTDPMTLNDVSFEVGEGDFIAIVGPTGGGKTTLLKLLLGLQLPTAGKILLGGQPATPSLWRKWRSQVGVVRQDDQLLTGSLADNIALFDPDANLLKIQEAANKAAIHDDILEMPMGYRTLIGDMGSSLSGGQRQRLLLARALYRDPKILVLDEGTANLDSATETLITDMVAQLRMTRIVVAHRPALVDCAERVFRVCDGKVEQVR